MSKRAAHDTYPSANNAVLFKAQTQNVPKFSSDPEGNPCSVIGWLRTVKRLDPKLYSKVSPAPQSQRKTFNLS